jgi:hypothetical protein
VQELIIMTGFRDPALEAALQRDGYVVVDFLEGDAVAQLLEIFYSRDVAVHHDPFGASRLSDDIGYRQFVDSEVRAAFATPFERLIREYRLCFGNFTLKQPRNPFNELPFHQDPAFVDEERFQAISIWCPLIDVGPDNGCICAVPGSHHLNRGPRGDFTPFPYTDLEPLLREKYLRPVPMKAGQAFLFSQKIFHTSTANRGDVLRVVATGLAAPHESRLRHQHLRADNRIEVYEVDDEFFTRHIFGREPAGVLSIGVIDYYYEPLTPERLGER